MKILIFFFLLLLLPFTAVAQDIEPTPTPRLLPSPDFPKEHRPVIPSLADGQMTLVGTVTFRGEVLPGVEVTVINNSTGTRKTVTTDDEGRFTVHGLAPGSYEVRVSKAGFAVMRQDIDLNIGQASAMNLNLEKTMSGEIPVGTVSSGAEHGYPSKGAVISAEVPIVPSSPSQTTSTADFVSKNFDNDIELLTWLNTKKAERKLLVRIITIRDKTSLFMFQTVKNAVAYQYTVSLVNEVLDENKLLVRINQNKGKTFIGMHPLTPQSYLMVFYGK